MQAQTRFSKLGLTIAALVAMSAFGGNAYAGTQTQTSDLAVSATVSANCTINASGAVAFGTYDPVVTHAAADLDAAGTISTVCTNGSTAKITLGEGTNAEGSSPDAPARRMTDGTDYLNYQLYQDSARSVVWGNTDTTGVQVTGAGTSVDTSVYGRVPQAQNVPAGDYNDTVVATITF